MVRYRVISVLALTTLSLAMVNAQEDDPHAHHRHMMQQQTQTKHSMVSVDVPGLRMTREDGKSVQFDAELNDGRPVVLNFIYTTCNAICPVSSNLFSQVNKKFGKDSDQIHLVSVSIDPEQDTPARLRDYAKRFSAGKNWNHYTGTVDNSVAIQVAFNVYRGTKMRHEPVTFVRIAPGQPWQRIDGFASADEVFGSYQELIATR